MIYGFWLDGFSFWAFLFFLGIATGIWIGVAHGAQIERVVARFRPGPKVTPEMARGVLMDLQEQLAAQGDTQPITGTVTTGPRCGYLFTKNRMYRLDDKAQ